MIKNLALLVLIVLVPMAGLVGYRVQGGTSNAWGTVPDWLMVVSALVLATVAVFQESIRGWFYRPEFRVTIKTEPPDCVAIPMKGNGLLSHSVYLRLWIKNKGNATAKNVEVFANELRQKRADGTWEYVNAFPPMNLRWANLGGGNLLSQNCARYGKTLRPRAHYRSL